jgi:hypothetical protein
MRGNPSPTPPPGGRGTCGGPPSGRLRARLLSATVLAFLLTGCGYHFVARDQALPTEGKRVFAPTFQNDTSEAGIEAVFTNAFRVELANAHAAGDSDAAVQARGVVTSVNGGPGQVFTSATGVVTSTASYYAAASACVRLVEGEKILGNACVSGTEDYQPGRDALEVEAARRVALQRLAVRLMKEAFERLSTGF